MWINDTYINEKSVAVAEPYIMDCSYGIKINSIPIEIGRTDGERYSSEEKEELLSTVKTNYIKEIEKCNG